jgi:hypothetical protein
VCAPGLPASHSAVHRSHGHSSGQRLPAPPGVWYSPYGFVGARHPIAVAQRLHERFYLLWRQVEALQAEDTSPLDQEK